MRHSPQPSDKCRFARADSAGCAGVAGDCLHLGVRGLAWLSEFRPMRNIESDGESRA